MTALNVQRIVRLGFFLLVPLSSAIADSEVKERLAVPSDAEQSAAIKTIADIYKGDYERAKTSEHRIALAKKMLADAVAIKDDVVGRYVLLRVSRDAAAQSGDIETAFAAIAEITTSYTADAPLMKLEVIRVLASKNGSPEGYQQLYSEANSLTDPWVQEDRYDLAIPLLQSLLPAARKLKDSVALERLTQRINEVEDIEKKSLPAKESLAVLAADARDGEANLTVGRFRCFFKGDWPKGFPHLALGSDKALASLAAAELREKPNSLEVGDQWWDLGGKAEGVSKRNLQRHAAELYRKALPGLSGLAKVKVERRLAELDKKVPEKVAVKPLFDDKEGPDRLNMTKVADLEGFDTTSLISHVVFSPDGTLLAANDRTTIKLWDLAKRAEKARFACPGKQIHSLAYSQDGKTIAVGCDRGSIQIWDVFDGKVRTTIEDAGSTYLAFTPDDSLLGGTTSLRVGFWRTSGKILFATNGKRFAISPVEKKVAIVQDQKLTFSSYVGGGQDIVVDKMPMGDIRDAKFLPDGKTLALLYLGPNRIDLFDVVRQQIKISIPIGDDAFTLAISPDGYVIAAEGSRRVAFWNTRTGRQIGPLSTHAWGVAFSPNRNLVALPVSGAVGIWEISYSKGDASP